MLRVENETIKTPAVIKSVGKSPCQYVDFDDEEDKLYMLHSPLVSMDELKRPLSAKEQKRANLINKYALAAANLYGIITKDDFV